MLPSWCNQSVTVIRPGTRTSRGSVMPDWDHPTKSITVSGCSVQPSTTGLSEDGRVLGIVDGMTAYLPEGTEVYAGDHIVYNGEPYEINGEPRIWRSPTGHNNHILLNLRRYAG